MTLVHLKRRPRETCLQGKVVEVDGRFDRTLDFTSGGHRGFPVSRCQSTPVSSSRVLNPWLRPLPDLYVIIVTMTTMFPWPHAGRALRPTKPEQQCCHHKTYSVGQQRGVTVWEGADDWYRACRLETFQTFRLSDLAFFLRGIYKHILLFNPVKLLTCFFLLNTLHHVIILAVGRWL